MMGYILGGFLVLQGVVWLWIIKQIRMLDRIYVEGVERYKGGDFCEHTKCPENKRRMAGYKGHCANYCTAYALYEYLDREGFSITRPRNRERKSKKEPY